MVTDQAGLIGWPGLRRSDFRYFLKITIQKHYRPEFWQMTNMEYLYGLWGVRVLSIE